MEKCKPIKAMIDAQIDLEFPIKTFSDKVVIRENKVASKKK